METWAQRSTGPGVLQAINFGDLSQTTINTFSKGNAPGTQYPAEELDPRDGQGKVWPRRDTNPDTLSAAGHPCLRFDWPQSPCYMAVEEPERVDIPAAVVQRDLRLLKQHFQPVRAAHGWGDPLTPGLEIAEPIAYSGTLWRLWKVLEPGVAWYFVSTGANLHFMRTAAAVWGSSPSAVQAGAAAVAGAEQVLSSVAVGSVSESYDTSSPFAVSTGWLPSSTAGLTAALAPYMGQSFDDSYAGILRATDSFLETLNAKINAGTSRIADSLYTQFVGRLVSDLEAEAIRS